MATRLEVFLKIHGIRPRHLADEAGVTRQHLLRLRLGRAEPTRIMMIWLAAACRRIMRRPVRVEDLFDLGDDDE